MTADEPRVEHAPEGIRCSDTERETAATALHAAVGEGRLSLAEVEERTATIYSARFRHELDAVLADLPRSAAPAPASGWRPVLTLAAQQLATDFTTLTGRGPAAGARRRAFLIAATALVFVAMLLLAVHGIADDGPHHGFGHD
ncbi:DUF1707 domain-containing protein [Amycolatopsis sp. NPDC023774]|uniref:DUF1707 SHOCT-like domain-containing protein n=1 Tax=Amycolatopsis sp. NPDC023774 TaxID=3155015 RepID=UPI003400CAFF